MQTMLPDVSRTRVAALVRDDAVHRDVYRDPAVFALERARLWRRSWLYAGHESQLAAPGALARFDLAGLPAQLRRDARGRPAVDAAVPVAVAVHRGFVFARASADGPSFLDWAGEMATVIDDLVDRSPAGRLEVAGAPIRSIVRANWKMYLENINDTVHPVSTHESVSTTAERVWAQDGDGAAPPMAMQQLLPFGSGYAFYERMGGRVLPGGHSILGTQASLHAGHGAEDGYGDALARAHGAERAARVLAFAPQNAVLYPSLSLKAMPAAIRVIRPLAVDRTLIEAWAFQPVDAPASLARRAQTYNRLVFSPMSVLAHDDLHVFESIQAALSVSANPWVSLHRRHAPGVDEGGAADVGGTDERLMRNQFRAWHAAMMRED